jgi:Fe-S-cluster containining protein
MTQTLSDDVLARLAERKISNDSQQRVADVQTAMTPEWQADMARRLGHVMNEPASARSKFPKLYALIERADEKRATHAACGRGCDACCHIQVEIADSEAQRIAEFTGRAAIKLPPGRHTTSRQKLGRQDTPCPFLVDHACSIYEARPFVCRDMAVLDVDALTCSFENMELARRADPRAVSVPQHTVRPVVEAFAHLTMRPTAAFADIRQFFPDVVDR